jgi:hypothetical protein
MYLCAQSTSRFDTSGYDRFTNPSIALLRKFYEAHGVRAGLHLTARASVPYLEQSHSGRLFHHLDRTFDQLGLLGGAILQSSNRDGTKCLAF